MATERTVSLRMSDAALTQLHALAEYEAVTLSQTIRTAVDRYLEERRSSPEWGEIVAAAQARMEEAMELLTDRKELSTSR